MASLWKQYKKEFEANEFEYLIVDNLSEDDSVRQLQEEIKKYKNFHVVKNDKNGGFGNGNNTGAKHAKGEYILFLNDDTVVEDRGLVKMLDYIKTHTNVGAIGGKLINADDSEQSASGAFYTVATISLFILGFQRMGFIDRNPKTISEVDWVKGALLMIKKSVFEKIGRFDEHIWMYTEDMEICYRVHKAGLKCVFYPDIKVRHTEHGSGNRTFAIINIYKNLPYFYKKHKSTLEYQYVRGLLQLKAGLLIIAGKLTNNHYLTNTYTQAYKALQ
jgi:GT2 family glycosyltransferase